MSVSVNLKTILSELPASTRLIAVTKTHPPAKILEAYEAGHKVFGENKVQELSTKQEQLPTDIEWHLIGHLQSNKIKYIAHFVTLIHSVDSLKLLSEINKHGAKINRVIHCLLQVHIAEEETKFGFSSKEVEDIVAGEDLRKLPFIKVDGLMGMATLTGDRQQIAKEFKELRSLFERLKKASLPNHVVMQELSMGMSSDYKIAVKEGSTMVRIGSVIFGDRPIIKS